MFKGVSFYADSVDMAMLWIVGISVFFLLGIVAVMIYFTIRYSRERNPVATQIHGNVALEIAWITVPLLIVLGMFWLGWKDFYDLRKMKDFDVLVKVEGRMWKWGFTYDNGLQTDTLYVPVNKVTKLELKSVDVNHAFFIPAFRLKEDVIASGPSYMVLTPEKVGSYDIACAEYCGLNHSYMYTKLKVMPQDDYDEWFANASIPKDSTAEKANLAEKSNAINDEVVEEAAIVPTEKVEKNAKLSKTEDFVEYLQNHKNFRLLTKHACLACHTTDGSKTIGPSFIDLFKGTTKVISNGKERQVKIDAKYIRKSILEPDADIVKGYNPYTMPSMKGRISDKDIDGIISIFLKK